MYTDTGTILNIIYRESPSVQGHAAPTYTPVHRNQLKFAI